MVKGNIDNRYDNSDFKAEILAYLKSGKRITILPPEVEPNPNLANPLPTENPLAQVNNGQWKE
jgi:hypothetical protein